MAEQSPADVFIVDNSQQRFKVLDYLAAWVDIARSFDIATGCFEIGALLAELSRRPGGGMRPGEYALVRRTIDDYDPAMLRRIVQMDMDYMWWDRDELAAATTRNHGFRRTGCLSWPRPIRSTGSSWSRVRRTRTTSPGWS